LNAISSQQIGTEKWSGQTVLNQRIKMPGRLLPVPPFPALVFLFGFADGAVPDDWLEKMSPEPDSLVRRRAANCLPVDYS
jgi:hypothetical protein